MAIYQMESNIIRNISSMFTGVESVARKINTGYIIAQNVARKFFSGSLIESVFTTETQYNNDNNSISLQNDGSIYMQSYCASTAGGYDKNYAILSEPITVSTLEFTGLVVFQGGSANDVRVYMGYSTNPDDPTNSVGANRYGDCYIYTTGSHDDVTSNVPKKTTDSWTFSEPKTIYSLAFAIGRHSTENYGASYLCNATITSIKADGVEILAPN